MFQFTKTKKLLIGGLFLVALLLIIMEVISVREINALAKQTENMYRHPLTVSNAVLEANANIIAMHRHMKDVVLARNGKDLELAVSLVDNDERKVLQHFEVVMDRFLGAKSRIVDARNAFVDWKDIRSEVIELSRKAEYEAAAAITKGKGARHVAFLTDQMNGLIDFARNKAAEFLAESKSVHRESVRKLRLLMAALLAMAVGATFFAFFNVDRSEKRIRESEEALRRSQKMEAVGQLTGGIAHDFNNILGIISGNLELLRRKVTDHPKALEYVEEAYEGAQRGAKITKKLLGFSRKDPGSSEPANVNEIIEGMENLIAKSLTARINVETHLSDNLWNVNIDPGDFEDGLINISLNARDAMPEGGSLVIETANKVLDEYYTANYPKLAAGEYVMVVISDDGVGMDRKTLERAFEPFFTTKEKGQGTGLGLSMVFGFVQRSGGHINLYSEPGNGTTVRMFLPRAVEGQIESKDVRALQEDALPRGHETVLVVDDETGLLKVATSFLEELGYKTVIAASGNQALEILHEQGRIDLMFSDVVLGGGMDGYVLAKKAKENYPDLKVLLTSGYTSKSKYASMQSEELFAELTRNLLAKPYNKTELALAVHKALDGGA